MKKIPASFHRYVVSGPKPTIDAILALLRDHAFKTGDFGKPDEVEYGWSGGDHVLDAEFSFDHNVFGDVLVFGLRIDTNKPPGSLKTAYLAQECQALAAGNPSGFISKAQKRNAKETVARKLEDEIRSGQHRRSKVVPVLWDLAAGTVYSTAKGGSDDKLREIFARSFSVELEHLTAGSSACRLLDTAGRRRDYEDMQPTRFVRGPEGEGQQPEYPWVAKGVEPKEFLGNEFLLWLWLWHLADTLMGSIPVAGPLRKYDVFFDRTLELDCAYGQTGRDALRGDRPTKMPEAHDALKSGKLPRKAGLIISVAGEQFSLALSADGLSISSLKLPEVEADGERELFEGRLAHLRTIAAAVDALFAFFLADRADHAWETRVAGIRKWVVAAKCAKAVA
jgi:hypothetical protein